MVVVWVKSCAIETIQMMWRLKGVVLDMEFDGILLKYTVKLTNGKHIHIIDKNDGFSKREIGSEISVFMNPADILQF